MKLLIITPPIQVEHELATINELFAMGLEILHLRKPGYSYRQIEELLTGIKQKFLTRVMLHSHHDLVARYGLRGCHFSTDLRERHDPKVFPECCSTSCHGVAELKQVQAGFEYCFISPVFDSISKPGYQAGINRSEVTRALPPLQTNVVALGGINYRTLPEVPGEWWGAAVLGAIWQEGKVRRRLESFQQLQKIADEL